MSEPVTFPTDGGPAPAHLWLPPGGQGPGIVLMQEIFGVSPYIERRAKDLADLGYVVLAPDVYWRLGEAATQPIEGPDALARGVALTRALDWDLAVADGISAVRALREHDDVTGAVGLVGFCFGGGLAFAVAAALEAQEGARPIDALVSYYGSALPGLVDHAHVSAPSLHHFGLADAFIPLPSIRHIEATVTRQLGTTFITHEGANHAFDNADMQWFDPEVSNVAWAQTLEFLAERLPVA